MPEGRAGRAGADGAVAVLQRVDGVLDARLVGGRLGGRGRHGDSQHPIHGRRAGEPVPSAAVPIEFEELELPFDEVADGAAALRDRRAIPRGTFPCCPLCGGELRPEHAHFRCACGWRDSLL